MPNLRKLGVLAAVFALSAIGAAGASAATFTASATGELSAKALENQVLTINGGTVACTTAATSGTIGSTSASQIHVTVKYSGCTAFGFASVDISDVTFRFTADGKAHVENAVTVTPTFFGSSMCTLTVGKQTLSTNDYANSGSNVKLTPTVTGIKYTSTGGSCGESGENGTYSGANEASRVGGGSVQFDA